jgi:hypothetical protein
MFELENFVPTATVDAKEQRSAGMGKVAQGFGLGSGARNSKHQNGCPSTAI